MRAGFLLFNLGELAAAEEQLEHCSSLAAELGSSRDEARATFPLALIKYLRGELVEAEQLGEQVHGWLDRTGETFFQIQNLIALAQYALARDDPNLAEERLREALPMALAESSVLLGDVYRYLTEAMLRQGRVDDAAALVDFADGRAPAERSQMRAAMLLAEAALATARGETVLANERYREALGLLEELDEQIDLCQSRIAYGRALREFGELDAAREQLETARKASLRMGAAGLAAQVDRELALVGSGAGG